MSETLATLESVRAACHGLIDRHEKVTANNVLKVTGGSKSTVLKHLDTVRKEIAASVEAETEPAVGMLRELSDPFIKRLWAEARAAADEEYRQNIKTLLDVQAGLLEDIRELQDRVAELLAEREGDPSPAVSEAHLDRIFELFERRMTETTAQGTSAVEDNSATPEVVKLLDHMSRSASPISREDMDSWIQALPTYRGKPSQLRSNTLEYGFIGFSLTEKGKRRLQRQVDAIDARNADGQKAV